MILSYGSGLRENHHMKSPEGQPEGTPKIRIVVTEGGAFPDGKLVHDKVSDINKFSHYGKRLKQLNVIQECHSLPMVVPQKDVITCVVYMVKMYQRTILNHYAFQQFFGDEYRCGKSAAEKLAFTCFKDVSPKYWNLIIEVEAVLNSCTQYAT